MNNAIPIQQGCPGPHKGMLDLTRRHHAAYAPRRRMDYWPIIEPQAVVKAWHGVQPAERRLQFMTQALEDAAPAAAAPARPGRHARRKQR